MIKAKQGRENEGTKQNGQLDVETRERDRENKLNKEKNELKEKQTNEGSKHNKEEKMRKHKLKRQTYVEARE